MATASNDHLFISYAWEDAALTEWLTLKLTAAGYKVWCDRFKLLGGEPWPADIDDAIKKRTFRVLHLLSHHSLSKPNPSKERELALALGRERGIPDFLIPLNVDRLSPAELPWRVSDLNYISFDRWDAGLTQLMKKLASIDAPRPLVADGPHIAAQAFLPPDVTSPESESITTNCLRIERVPQIVYRFQTNRPIHMADTAVLANSWAFRQTAERSVLAFSPPPAELRPHLSFTPVGGGMWSYSDRFDGIVTSHLITELLNKEILLRYLRRGLRWNSRRDLLYVPRDLLPNDRIVFQSYTGKRTYVQAGGERTFGKDKFRYRLGVSAIVRRDVLEEAFAVILRPRFLITDIEDKELSSDAAFARRKQTARWYFNHEWLQRARALLELLDISRDLQAENHSHDVLIGASFVGADVAPRVNEEQLLKLGLTPADPPTEPEGVDDEAAQAEEATA